MKPSEHHEFFRLPAPAGRSRESAIVLDREGRWHHEGAAVAHEGLARALASWVRRHPDDRRLILANDQDWCYFTALATPCFVASVWVDGGAVLLRLLDDSVEPLAAETLTVDLDGTLRCVVRDKTMDARFLRSAQLMVEPLLEDGDPPGIRVGGVLYPITSGALDHEDEPVLGER